MLMIVLILNQLNIQMNQLQQSNSNGLPKRQTSFFSRLFLFWSSDYTQMCHQKNVDAGDIAQVEPTQPFGEMYGRWSQFWQESAKIQDDSQENGERLKWTIMKTFQKQLIVGALMSFLAYQSSVLTPLVVYKISSFIDEGIFNMNISIIILALIFSLKMARGFFTMHSEYLLKKVGGNIFCCLCHSLAQKSLKKTHFPKGEITISQKAKLAQYDCSKIVEYPLIWTQAVFELYSLLFALVCLTVMASWQAFICCIVLFTLNMVRYILVSVFKSYQKKVNQSASNRIKKETESINNMKFIKVNALEDFFFKKLNLLREIEVALLQKFLNLGIIATVIQYMASRFSIVVFIFLYTITGHAIHPALIFSIMLFHNCMALHKLMNKANNLEDIRISITKIEDYLINQEKDMSYITRSFTNTAEYSVSIENGNFYWQKQSNKNQVSEEIMFSLKDVSFKIKKGEFIALVGQYGSGKSSILNAILGQMNNQTSKVTINGTIAYANQTPWILNDSVKNNILFGEPFEESRYKRALYYSRLETDLKLFANGEETVIGEKGSTLSGGQRARISLARALYKEADIYILDDILSALDAHVSAFIFQETLAKHLQKKTIVLATHLQNYLNLVNRVFMISQGKIDQILDKSQLLPQVVGARKLSGQHISQNYRQSQRHSQNYRQSMQGGRKSTKIELQQMKILELSMMPPAEVEKQQQMSQSQLLKLFVRRRGGAFYIIHIIFFMLLIIITNLILFSWLNHWVNSADSTNPSYYYIYLTALAACMTSIGIHAYLEFNSNFFYQTHKMMVRSLLTAPMSYFQTTPISNSMNKLSSDLKKIDNQVVSSFRDALFFISFGTSFITNSILIYIRKDQMLMILIILVSILFIIYYYYFFMVAVRQMHSIEQQSQIPIYSSFVQILCGSSTIRAYNKQNFMKQKQKSKIQRFLMTRKIMAGIQSYFTFVISLVTTVVTSILLVKILIGNNSNVVDFFLIYNIFSFERSVENIHKILLDFLSNLKYLGYCEQLITIPQQEGYDLVQKDGQLEFKERISASEWIKEGVISFQNYSVKYRPQLQTVLKDLTLNIKTKEKIGVVGRTGSGKSTTILSLLRIVKLHEGNIKIDDINIDSLDIQTLRVGFSIILQEHFLFSGTVRQNIDPLNEFPDQKIIHSLQLCGLWQALKERNGLSTVVQENGSNFSAGEKQLINISRTLLNPKKIVLIDQATASIDYRSDEMLQQLIKRELKNSTMVTIAHRIDTILESDRILVLDKGKIIELDSPSQLLKKEDSVFRGLYKKSQNRSSADLFSV